MITYFHLSRKIDRQAEYLANTLNLTDEVAKTVLANSVYCETDIRKVKKNLDDNFKSIISNKFPHVYWLKYLLINEIEDDIDLINDLRKCAEFIAARFRKQVVINVKTTRLISIIFELFGLEDEAKYIVNAPENFDFDWQPRFDFIVNPKNLLFADFKINEITMRCIALKYGSNDYTKLELRNVLDKMLVLPKGGGIDSDEDLENKSLVDYTKLWFRQSAEALTNLDAFIDEDTPYSIIIDGKKYAAFAFPLSNALVEKNEKHLSKIKVSIRNILELQTFILKFKNFHMVLEVKKHKDSEVSWHYNHCEYTHALSQTLYLHQDSRRGPVPIFQSAFSIAIRPFTQSDLITL